MGSSLPAAHLRPEPGTKLSPSLGGQSHLNHSRDIPVDGQAVKTRAKGFLEGSGVSVDELRVQGNAVPPQGACPSDH